VLFHQTKDSIRTTTMGEPDRSSLLSLEVDEAEEVDCDLSIEDDDEDMLVGFGPETSKKANDLYLDDDGTGFDYILGTLIVRVVAARDLEAGNKNGIGRIIFGAGGPQERARNTSRGTSNPYASVRFGKTAQRTSEVYGTVDPLWPRGEAMYMDVVHPELPQVATPSTAGGAQSSFSVPETAAVEDPFAKEGPMAARNLAPAHHPGDPPTKPKGVAAARPATLKSKGVATNVSVSSASLGLPTMGSEEEEEEEDLRPVLTVAVFHTNNDMSALASKFPSKSSGGDSDDMFLGAAEIDLTTLITGKIRSFDEWLPLLGSNSDKATVRVVCEYESSDAPPKRGDLVKFTDFCNERDIFPARPDRLYTATEIIDADQLLISWTSPEGWISTYDVHRFMLICVKRHHSVVDVCQDELASIRERISHSPMVHAVQDTLEKVPEEGLISISADLVGNTASLVQRWWTGGIERTAEDLNFATNWDGRHNPAMENLSTALESPSSAATEPDVLFEEDAEEIKGTILPNMPNCPITGEPMRDPVVAADVRLIFAPLRCRPRLTLLFLQSF
jgi:C2 domain